MSGPKAGSGAGSGIPASDRKLVLSLKEIVPNSEEEIYAMLRECNRDPDETAQRLLSEGKFHIVKRKRDKRKETTSNKETSDARSRLSNSGASNKGGKTVGTSGRSVGRGNSLSRSSPNDVSGGRGKTLALKENGILPSIKGSSSASASVAPCQPAVLSKGSLNETVGSPLPSSSAYSNGDSLYPVSSPGLQGAWLAGPGPSTPAGLQGAWLAGSGHATMADILKSGGTRLVPPSVSTPVGSTNGSVVESVPTSSQLLVTVPTVSGVFFAASDPVLNPTLDPRARTGVVKREVGTVGNHRSVGDRSSSFSLPDASVVGSPHPSYVNLSQTSNSGGISVSESDVEINVLQPINPSGLPSASLGEQVDSVQNSASFPRSQALSLGLVESSRISTLSPSRTGALGSQFISVPLYHAQQLIGTHTGSSVDWISQSMGQHDNAVLESEETESAAMISEGVPSSPASPSVETSLLSTTAAKLQELNIRDDQPVIIPDHLRVSESDCTRLSFGSFDPGFEAFSSFMSENKSIPLPGGECTMENGAAVGVQASALSVITTASSTVDPHQPHLSEALDIIDDGAASDNLVTQSELAKREDTSHQSPQYTYLTAAPSYPGVNSGSPNHTSHYAVEQSESRSSDINRLSNVLQSYSDPAATYYSGIFRSGSEVGDTRYSTFLPSTVPGKYGPGRPAGTGQSSSSQEGANAIVFSNSNTAGQTLQSGNVPTAMTLPQQSLPIHPYAAQPSALPMGHFANVFSYQYMPPGFSYVQSPYQHSYAGTGSYHQVPSAGAATVKYSLPQYKAGASVGAGMHNTVAPGTLGYGGYSNSPPGTYAVNSPVTVGNISGFDDVSSQYKDTNLYIPGQQVEGSAMWLQAQLSRELPGVQSSSYYNITGQNQPTRYSQAQSLHAHSHPGNAYGSLYHPQQSGPSPSASQLLQQPQILASVGALGTQVGSYQQSPRAQQTWTNSL